MNFQEAQCVVTAARRLWLVLLLCSASFLAVALALRLLHGDFGMAGDSITLIAYVSAANGVLLAIWSLAVLWDQSRARKLLGGVQA